MSQGTHRDIVHTALHIIGDEVVLVVTVFVVAAEVAGRRVGEVAGHHDAGLLAQLLRLHEHGGNVRAVGGGAHMAVAGLLAGRERRAARAGVRDELVGAIGAGQAHGREVVQVQLAVVQHPGAADLLEAHAVADHDDDVAHLVVHGRHGHIDNLIGIGRRVILKGGLFLLLVLAGDGRDDGSQGEDGYLFHISFR